MTGGGFRMTVGIFFDRATLREPQGPPFDWFDYAHQPRAGNGEAFLPDSKKRMDARLSSLKNCHAVLQYPRKSMEGFSWVVRRYGGAR